MYNSIKYKEKILESGLVVPTGVETVVTLKVERDGVLGSTLTGFYTITPSNSCYPTLVLEFADGDILNNSFAKHVLSDQGIDVDVIKAATVHIR